MERQTSTFIQIKVGEGRTDIQVLLQPRATGYCDPRTDDAFRCRERRGLAVPVIAHRCFSMARALPWMLVAWQRRPVQGRIRQN